MSKTAAREIKRDDQPLFTGTHEGGSSSSTLYVQGAMFRALGVDPQLGQYVANTTQGTYGNVTAATNDEVTVSGVTWDYGDSYEIYVTDTKNSYISSVWTDVSRGWKVTDQKEVDSRGWRPEDADLDGHNRAKIFGPGQPEGN